MSYQKERTLTWQMQYELFNNIVFFSCNSKIVCTSLFVKIVFIIRYFLFVIKLFPQTRTVSFIFKLTPILFKLMEFNKTRLQIFLKVQFFKCIVILKGFLFLRIAFAHKKGFGYDFVPNVIKKNF